MITACGLLGYHYFNGFKVHVFGYDKEKNIYWYSVETPHSSRVRTATGYYKSPDKRNEWRFPFGDYIYITDPQDKQHRIQADYRP